MINKLRKKFIVITGGALLGVIATLIISINIIYIYKGEKSLDKLIDIIIENDGVLSNDYKEHINKKELDNTSFKDKFFKRNYLINREMIFTTRFCVVNLDENKSIIDIYSEKISAISEEEIKEYTEKILTLEKNNGWINNYKYKLVQINDGYRVIILDGSIVRESNWSIFTTSILVSLISYLVILIIVALSAKKAIRPIAESYEKQKQFITDASHELKTPLTIISANSEILEMTYGKDEWIEGIEKQSQNMRDLVNNLVLLSKMDEEKQSMVYEEFNLSDAVYDTVMAFEGLCRNSKKRLNIDINYNIYIKGDESTIRQLISILIDNAVKYCDENGEIYVSLRSEKQILFEVSNTYEEVKNVELDRLFDRFYRVDKARTRNGSYGLGLSIAEAIVEKYKGKIKVTEIDNNLIQFEVRLPI